LREEELQNEERLRLPKRKLGALISWHLQQGLCVA
jgi:hypothetical protein